LEWEKRLFRPVKLSMDIAQAAVFTNKYAASLRPASNHCYPEHEKFSEYLQITNIVI